MQFVDVRMGGVHAVLKLVQAILLTLLLVVDKVHVGVQRAQLFLKLGVTLLELLDLVRLRGGRGGMD
jgi:hypothetical protein